MKTLRLCLLAVVAVLMAACSGAGANAVADKITKGEVLTQADYAILIDYCGKYAQEAQPIQDRIDNLPTDSPEIAGLNAQLAELKDKFPHISVFFDTLNAATPKEVGSENVRKVDSLGRLIWFDTPEWASVQEDPSTAGFVETTAPAQSDDSIVAAPVLEEKTENR